MMKLQFASLSLGASVDQQTGSLSVFDVVEEIRTPQLPIQIQSLAIALALEKIQPGAQSGKLFIHIVTPDGQNSMVGNGEMAIPADQKRLKAVFRLGAFPINQYGAHRFVLSWLGSNGAKQGEALLDFEVVQVAMAPEGELPGGMDPTGGGRTPLPN